MVFITILIILFILVLTFFLIYELYPMFNNTGKKEYEIKLPIKGDGANKNICPRGCVRGVCRKWKHSKCKHDYECNYCRDRKTDMFYVDFNNESTIVPQYEESKNLKKTDRDILNEKIFANNIYINNLNKKIIENNHD